MIIVIPREIKQDEYRVAMLPVGAELLKRDGHKIVFEKGAGLGSGFDDAAYASVGAELVDSAEELYAQAEMIVKVKDASGKESRPWHMRH
jgi:alanine dehydrogenase